MPSASIVLRTTYVALLTGTLTFAASPAVVASEGTMSAPAPTAPAPRAAAAADAPVVARTGNLTQRFGDGTGARRLASATVRQDLVRDRISGTFVLDAAATAGTSSELRVTYGHVTGNTCQGDIEVNTSTTGTQRQGFTRSGRTYRLDIAAEQAGFEDWDCAFVSLTDDLTNAPTTYSQLGGPLVDVLATPKLTITGAEVLGKKVRTLGLVRNNWTLVSVTLRNSGRVDAEKVVVTGKGKGLKVRKDSVSEVFDDSTHTARLQVKAVKGKVGPLRLKVDARNARPDGATVKTRTVKPPRRPAAGTYQVKGGDITFRITGGRTPKVAEFRARVLTVCGGFPDIPTQTFFTYDFPTTRIGRDGVLDARQRRDLFSASLRLKAVGTKVRLGRFSYSGPDRCSAVKSFDAKRTGR